MRAHHTKNKGDLGLLHAQVDLAYLGARFFRVQVKYRAAVNGVIYVPFKSCWADRHGVHTVAMDKRTVDVVCVYCPDTRRCYYIDPRRHGKSVQLRLQPPRNGQSRGVLLADAFLEFPKAP
jgi:hypothetical protein